MSTRRRRLHAPYLMRPVSQSWPWSVAMAAVVRPTEVVYVSAMPADVTSPSVQLAALEVAASIAIEIATVHVSAFVEAAAEDYCASAPMAMTMAVGTGMAEAAAPGASQLLGWAPRNCWPSDVLVSILGRDERPCAGLEVTRPI